MPGVLSKHKKEESEEESEYIEESSDEEVKNNDEVEESEEEFDEKSEEDSEESDINTKTKQKIIICYNQYLKAFIKKFKGNNENISKVIKKHKRVEMDTMEYMYCFDVDKYLEKLNSLNLKDLKSVELFQEQSFKDLTIYHELKLEYIIENLSNDNDKLFFIKYIMIFNILKYLHQLDQDDYIEELFLKMINVLGESNIVNISKYTEDILDDEIIDMIKQMVQINAYIDYDMKKNAKETGNPDEFMKNIEGTQIGKLAKEISEDINLDDFNINNMQDLLGNFTGAGGAGGNGGNGGNGRNLFQTLFEKIGSKITNKIDSGELKHDELISDAFGMMNQLNNDGNANPLSGMMNQVMQNMSNMKGMGKGGHAKAQVNRDKLRKEQQKQKLREKLKSKRMNES